MALPPTSDASRPDSAIKPAFGDGNVFVLHSAGAVIEPISLRSVISGRTLGMKCEQPPLGDEQIRQPEQGVQLRRVFEQTAVTELSHPN